MSSLETLDATTVRVLTFVMGALIGSFLNVCVARWPKELSVVSPRSRCPRCAHEIAWFENVPMLSWLALRARCRGCHERISAMYPLVELIVALGWLGAVVAYGPGLTALRVAVFGTILFGVVLTDAMEYVIPDGFTAFGLFWAVLMAVVAIFVPETSPFASLYDSLVGACAAAGAIAIVGWLGEMALKKEAMGFGDVTLMAMIGAHLGVARSVLTIFLGAALGAFGFLVIVFPIAWVRSKRAGTEFEPPLVPFGVFLAPAAMMALLFGDALVNWYRGLTGL
ncbi:MAG TPA: prepilin peptidase [Gemmatimonadaceae bacterium]|jgi:Type II secretory pathway, prepilin signal peptidase PulO and related peptidases